MLLRKLVLSFLVSLIVLFSVAPYFSQVQAASTTPSWYNQGFGDWYVKVYDQNNPSEIFGERYTAAQVQWVVYGLWSFIINFAFGPKAGGLIACAFGSLAANQDVATCLGPALTTFLGSGPPVQDVSSVQNVGLLSLVFADRPLSGVTYVKGVIKNFNLVPTAHAQTPGFGFGVLSPIQDMWRGVRDISFGLFVIVAIVFSFMIMFRVKISPQVVITVQSAIPKIIIALILVTFSYAIAGFLVDLMYVVIGFISLAASPLVFNLPATNIFNFLTLGQLFGSNANLGVLLLGIIYLILFTIFLIILLALFLGGTGIALAAIVAPVIATATAGLGPVILVLLAILAVLIVLWNFIKTVFGLVKAFAMIVLLTIFAPIQISLGAVIPNFGFNTWLRSFLSNLATFVLTGIMLLLSYIFLVQGIVIGVTKYAPDGLGFVLNFIFGPGVIGAISSGSNNFNASWPPLLGGGNAGASMGLLFLGVSFVLFTMIPKANDIVQSIISGKPFAYGTAIGEAFGPRALREGVGGAGGAIITAGGARYAGRIISRYGGARGAQMEQSLNAYADKVSGNIPGQTKSGQPASPEEATRG